MSTEMQTVKQSSASSNMPNTVTPPAQEAGTSHLSCVRERFLTSGISERSVDIMMASWREGTKVQYDTYIRKWVDYCKQAKCDLVSPPVSVAFDFLTSLFDTGLSYSSINTARSALSSVLVIENSKMPFGQLPLVRRFMKGIFELRPSLPRYPTV